MKKNRSKIYTKGLCCTFNDTDKRICLFECDFEHRDAIPYVLDVYRIFGLDVLYHRTGCGWHFISPTLVGLETWKDFHNHLKHINPKCPMTTLRIVPNKHPNEADIWYQSYYKINRDDCTFYNSIEICDLLRKWFGDIPFTGEYLTSPKIVRYPLPL